MQRPPRLQGEGTLPVLRSNTCLIARACSTYPRVPARLQTSAPLQGGRAARALWRCRAFTSRRTSQEWVLQSHQSGPGAAAAASPLQSEVPHLPPTCKDFLERHPQEWRAALHHPFLDACRDGTVGEQQFNAWLAQDYLFVRQFARFVEQVLAHAPAADSSLLLSGIAALKDELAWFRVKARERWLQLQAPMQATNTRYCRFMEAVAKEPYAVQAVVMWSIEHSYNQAWALLGPVQQPYDEVADRWGNPGFTKYVGLLQRQADTALQAAPQAQWQQAEDACTQVAKYEEKFWQMAFNTVAI